MGMSYSKCWKLLNRAEEQMGFPFLNRYNGGRHGGNSTITEEGREFMNRYHAMLEDIKRISQNFFDIYFQDYQQIFIKNRIPIGGIIDKFDQWGYNFFNECFLKK